MSSTPDREIPQRELRNDISRVLREVQEGAHITVTVRGKPVAELIPTGPARQFIPRADAIEILEEAPLDRAFDDDVGPVLEATIEEL